MYFNTLTTLALAYFAHSVAGQDYSDTCTDIYLSEETFDSFIGDEPVLNANCGGVSTWLDINACFGGNGGTIYSSQNGWLSVGCESFSLDGTVLSASCWGDDETWQDSSIDTNDFITNLNGQLSCFGEFGSDVETAD